MGEIFHCSRRALGALGENMENFMSLTLFQRDKKSFQFYYVYHSSNNNMQSNESSWINASGIISSKDMIFIRCTHIALHIQSESSSCSQARERERKFIQLCDSGAAHERLFASFRMLLEREWKFPFYGLYAPTFPCMKIINFIVLYVMMMCEKNIFCFFFLLAKKLLSITERGSTKVRVIKNKSV